MKKIKPGCFDCANAVCDECDPDQDARGDAETRCDKCGAEITTGMMAAFCPRREGCEFWPHDADPESIRMLDWIGGRAADSAELPAA